MVWLPCMVCAGTYYQLFAYWEALHNVSYTTFIDSRDGQSYRVYKVEKPYRIESCTTGEDCLDTGMVFLFAENIRYVTEHSICYNNDCSKYGRYYPKRELFQVCPDGWSIPTADDAGVVSKSIIDNDTIYASSSRRERFPQTNTFPDDNVKITDSYSHLSDAPSGLYDGRYRQFRYVGKLGTIWVKFKNGEEYYPTFIDFNKISHEDINGILQSGVMEQPENMFPIKCYKAEQNNASKMGKGLFSADRID